MNPPQLIFALTVGVSFCVSVPLFAQAQWGEYHTDKEIEASVPEAYDQFGHGVDISGNLAVVTSRGDDDQATSAGAVFLLGRNQGGPGNWGEIHKLIPPDAASGDSFGQACAISGNLVVASSLQGSGYPYDGAVYYLDASTGLQTQKLTILDSTVFAFGGDIDTDGNHVIVGARRHWTNPTVYDVGVAYIFDAAGGLVHTLSPSDGAAYDYFGTAVAIDGNRCMVSSPSKDSYRGTVYVYDVATGAELYKLNASDVDINRSFGRALAMEGNRAIIGSGHSIYAYGDGAAYYFDLATGLEIHRFDTEQTAGTSAALGMSVAIAGDYAFLGCPGPSSPVGPVSGRIYQVDLDYLYTMAWFVHPDPLPANYPSKLGFSVATDGITVFNGHGDAAGGVGILSEGRAHVMTRALIGLGVDKYDTYAGDTVTFKVRGGKAGGISGSAVMAINGVAIAPILIPGSIGRFDGQGEWSFQVNMPSGLGAMLLTIQTLGKPKVGGLVFSNTRDLNNLF